MIVARYLVQGCDVWLNTPRRPHEASGTSGMKALANGVLNVSTLDGWWDEAWRSASRSTELPGWAIGSGEDYESDDLQDQVEAEALYDLLERDIVPLFYDRGKDGVPRRWIVRMKASIRTLSPAYNIQRQIKEYTEEFYLKAHARFAAMTADNAARSRALAGWIDRVRSQWAAIAITALEAPGNDLDVGGSVFVRASVRLGGLTPDDVRVELIAGRLDKQGEMTDTIAFAMVPVSQRGDEWVFESRAPCCPSSGLYGFTVRVLPSHADLSSAFVPGLILWADGNTAQRAMA
jgi:starch phosphorylase